MIRKQNLTQAELDEIEQEAQSSFLAIPVTMITVFIIFNWILGMPWIVFWGCIAFVVIVFLILGDYGKKTMDTDLNEGVKLIRSGKVVKVNRQVSYSTRLTSVDITLEKELIPEPYPEIHQFSIYNSLLQLYHKKDSSLQTRYEELMGQTVEIEYFPYSGHVLSFKES